MLTQRLGSVYQQEQWYIDELIKMFTENKGCCDEVWFSTEYGYPSVEKHAKVAEKISKFAKDFENAGIRVSLQISNTIGHGQYMSAKDCSALVYDGSPVRYIVGQDGSESKYSFCWRDEYFRKYINDVNAEYLKRMKPHRIWVDDDLRATAHAPARFCCFCDDCIKTFNEQYGTSFTREEIVYEMQFGDVLWRERYLQFIRDGIYDFTYQMCKEILKIQPDALFAIQHVHYGEYLFGDYKYIYQAMYDANGKAPASRPGGGVITCHDVNEFVRKGEELLFQMMRMPDYVKEIRPEIENLPDVIYGKSIAGTCFETSYFFALGVTDMSYAMMMRTFEPFSWQNKAMAEFARHRPYWKKLSDVNKKTKQSGVGVAYSTEAWKIKNEEGMEFTKSQGFDTRVLKYNNLPIAFENEDCILLHRNITKRMGKKDIDNLLSKNVMTDATTIEMLCEMGYKFGIRVESIDALRIGECFTDHEVNRGFEGKRTPGRFAKSDGYTLIDLDGKTDPIAIYKSIYPECNGKIANAIIETEKGGKWAVFGTELWNRGVASEKKDQVLNVAEYLSGKPLAARLMTPWQAIIYPRVYDNGELAAVSIVNCCIGKSEELCVRLLNPAGDKFTFISQYGGEAELKADKKEDGFTYVTIPQMDAWSVGTIFCE